MSVPVACSFESLPKVISPPVAYKDNNSMALPEFCSPQLDITTCDDVTSEYFSPECQFKAKWLRWTPEHRLVNAWILVQLGAHRDAPSRFRSRIVRAAGELVQPS